QDIFTTSRTFPNPKSNLRQSVQSVVFPPPQVSILRSQDYSLRSLSLNFARFHIKKMSPPPNSTEFNFRRPATTNSIGRAASASSLQFPLRASLAPLATWLRGSMHFGFWFFVFRFPLYDAL